MQVIPDASYNTKYPERPKRFIISDDGSVGPTYVTADVIPISIARAEADLTKWNEIQTIVAEF